MQGTEIPPETGKQYRSDAHDFEEAGCAVNAADTFYNPVTGFDALYDSMLKCKKGVMWKASVASYRLNAVERTIDLMEQLYDGTWEDMQTTTPADTAVTKQKTS